MAISKNTGIDFAKIAIEMRAITERWYNASVEIIDPNLEDQTWDYATNTYTNNPASSIWSGKARIQPIASESLVDLDVAQGSVRKLRIQVPYDESLPLIREGLQIVVTDGGENLQLENVMITVRGAINSSYGWNTTIECNVDIKNPISDGS